MSIGEKFTRSWSIAKKTFQVMRHDKEILLFPILSSLFSVILFLIFVFPFFLSALSNQGRAYGGFLYLGIFAFYFIVSFTATFFNVGVVHIAETRFSGGNATFSDGIKIAVKRLKQILAWSLLSATVGLVLNMLQNQAKKKGGIAGIIGSILVSIVGFAWAIVSVFVVPAIAIKGYGPVKALKSSAATIKKTWGESLIRYYGLGMAKSIFLFVGIVFFLLPGAWMFISTYISDSLFGFTSVFGLVLVGVFILYASLVSVVFSSANTIFNTALFMYAESGKVPKFYSQEEMSHAFKMK
jgi:hypothetical protein